MRKINTRNFTLATRQTGRDVNRRIVLNLIREYQPISRAELARRMKVRRGVLTSLVRDLIEGGDIHELGPASTVRGRRPRLLALQSHGRFIVAVDVRPGFTNIALATSDSTLTARTRVDTPREAEALPEAIEAGVAALLGKHAPGATVRESCMSASVVLPGMIDRNLGTLLYSPLLGWRDAALRKMVAERLGIRTFIESAPIACALARLWGTPEETRRLESFAYVHVSDGIGVGLVFQGEAVRGDTHSAGEFGHVRLSDDGPLCACGKRGCWEALASNRATIGRYAGSGARGSSVDIYEVIRRAKQGEPQAVEAMRETGRLLGRGLSVVVSAFNPGRIFVGGEITASWDLLEGPIRETLVAEALTPAAAATPVQPDGTPGENRLKGAVALANAPSFAALEVG